MNRTIKEVESFWNANPLFKGESAYQAGTKEFFEEHTDVYIEDVFSGKFPNELFIPEVANNAKVLDLGCGAGFWTVLLARALPSADIYAADLTETALQLTAKRLALYQLQAHLSKQNAEDLKYPDNHFDHVNCQGVIHHTPNTSKAVSEIARVVKPGGTAYISVYYRNFFLRNWRTLSVFGKLLARFGGQLKGRGREAIFEVQDIDELTRLYDGSENPVGKSYTQKQITDLISQFFEIDKVFLNFFPARALPFTIPKWLHRFLSRRSGFMIHLNLTKHSTEE